MNDLLSNHPKVAALLRAYFMDLLLENSKGLPEDFKEFAKKMGVKDENIAISMQVNPSTLFRFFDGRNIYITLKATKPCFVYEIMTDDDQVSSTCFETRIEAEHSALAKAFTLLEKVLPEEEPNEIG